MCQLKTFKFNRKHILPTLAVIACISAYIGVGVYLQQELNYGLAEYNMMKAEYIKSAQQ